MLVVLTVFLTGAGSARAATIEVEAIYQKAAYTGDRLKLRAAAGEVNAVTISQLAPGLIRVVDAVPLEAGRGCANESPLVVRCTGGVMLGIMLDATLGDGDDTLTAANMDALFGKLDGGPGDDHLVGPANGGMRFRGGPGDDHMEGGAGGDTFIEGARANGSDTFAGGSSADPQPLLSDDAVDYSSRRRAIRADFAGDRDDGERRERDRIAADVERIAGGIGPDRLTGDAADNQLSGGPGNDVLRGGRGDDLLESGSYGHARLPDDDVLDGGPGDDRLDGDRGRDALAGGPGHDSLQGGANADRVRSRDGVVDAVLCGDGGDRVAHDPSDWLASDCERQGRIPEHVVPLAWADGGDRLFLVLGCPFHPRAPCRAEATLEVGGQAFGPDAFTLKPGRYAWLLLSLGGRTEQDPAPPLDDGVVVLTSPSTHGRVVTERIPLSAVHREPSTVSFFLPPVLPFL